MKANSQNSKLQADCGLRWIIAALLIFCAMGSAHAADRKSCTATLHISVTVMPIVQAQALAQNNERAADTASVAYRLQPVVLKPTREVRSLAIATKGQASVAVLETVTTVAD
ncbi:MAG TPA: hypothetical protein VN682_05435 [Terriglobales bacterium]|nr:hypothetical protein [Terriglobales bacterium]